jgi:hypothetical protein
LLFQNDCFWPATKENFINLLAKEFFMAQKESEEKKEDKKEPKAFEATPAERPERADKLNAIRENEIKDLLAKSEISLSLDTYDDIFSDFDPRPYSERALSDDFLNESRKAARDKPKTIELNFLIPEKLRNLGIEAKIKRRLKEHFKKHYLELEDEAKRVMKKGMAVAFVGFFLMILATMLYDLQDPSLPILFLRTMIEPSGWFMVWYGLDQIFYTKNQHRPEKEFYMKMSNANITFTSF